jgi:hypothetical protein
MYKSASGSKASLTMKGNFISKKDKKELRIKIEQFISSTQ